MKMSSKKTMLTAAVLVTLSSGTAFAATPGTVDSQELFHANRLVTDPANVLIGVAGIVGFFIVLFVI